MIERWILELVNGVVLVVPNVLSLLVAIWGAKIVIREYFKQRS